MGEANIQIRGPSGHPNVDISHAPMGEANIHLPGPQNVTESGLPLGLAHGVKFVRAEADAVVLEVESGDYIFRAR
jgi:hypothetical protein